MILAIVNMISTARRAMLVSGHAKISIQDDLTLSCSPHLASEKEQDMLRAATLL